MIEASQSTQAAYLASQYVTNLYYTPQVDGKPNIEALTNLLGKAKITWIRNGVPSEYTLDEMIGKLMQGFYEGMSKIVVLSSGFFSNELSPRAETQTIQYYNGDADNAAGPYLINSNIQIKVQIDPETKQLFIAEVTHNYTNFSLA